MRLDKIIGAAGAGVLAGTFFVAAVGSTGAASGSAAPERFCPVAAAGPAAVRPAALAPATTTTVTVIGTYRGCPPRGR